MSFEIIPHETIIYTKKQAVAEIRFNRPQRLNAVIEQFYDELLAALDEAEKDRETRVIILTGEGRAFCVGADTQEHGRGERTPFQRREYLRREQAVCKRLITLPKPIVAAVNGFALGAGAEMAIASDFILMAESAEFGLPETSVGAFPGGGITYLLPRLVGMTKARELIFLGERIDGREAAAIGLANRVFPDAIFMEEVYRFVEQLAGKAPLSMELAKEQLNRHWDLESALTSELEGMMFCTTTRDWQEGLHAFAEKRRPVFKGE
jgi:enoyl-CoA hydratase